LAKGKHWSFLELKQVLKVKDQFQMVGKTFNKLSRQNIMVLDSTKEILHQLITLIILEEIMKL